MSVTKLYTPTVDPNLTVCSNVSTVNEKTCFFVDNLCLLHELFLNLFCNSNIPNCFEFIIRTVSKYLFTGMNRNEFDREAETKPDLVSSLNIYVVRYFYHEILDPKN